MAGELTLAMAVVRKVIAWLDGRRRVSIALLLGWTVVIGVGAGAAPSTARWVGLPSLEWATYVFVGVVALLWPAMLVAALVFRRRGIPVPVRRKPVWPLLALLLILVVALSLRQPGEEEAEPGPEQPVADDEESGSAGSPVNVLADRETGAIVLIFALSVGALVWSRRRIAGSQPAVDDAPGRPLESDLAPAVGLAAEQLLLGSDPRSAVLAAYAELERALSHRDLERQAAETPFEHLERVLTDLLIDPDPLLRLASLYEVARFSDHAITASDQRQAADSLGRARDELAALA